MDKERIKTRSSAIEIIPFSLDYLDQILVGAAQMHEDSIYADMPLDQDKLIKQFASCTQLGTDRYFRLAVRKGVLLGAFFGQVKHTFFCDDLLANDLGWWIIREHRCASAAAMRLLFDFEEWAKVQGAKKVMVGQVTARNVEKITKFYEHCGFRVVGYNTVKDI